MSELVEFNMNDPESPRILTNIKRKMSAQSLNKPEEEILQIWAEKASGWAWLHNRAHRYYTAQSNLLMYPSIILSTLMGGIGFINKNNNYIFLH